MSVLSRAKVICSNNNLCKKEISYLHNLFIKNGYSSWFFDELLKKFDDRDKLGMQN